MIDRWQQKQNKTKKEVWRLTPDDVVLVDGLHSDHDHGKHRDRDHEHADHTQRHEPDLHKDATMAEVIWNDAKTDTHANISKDVKIKKNVLGGLECLFNIETGRLEVVDLLEDGEERRALATFCWVSDLYTGFLLSVLVVWGFLGRNTNRLAKK